MLVILIQLLLSCFSVLSGIFLLSRYSFAEIGANFEGLIINISEDISINLPERIYCKTKCITQISKVLKKTSSLKTEKMVLNHTRYQVQIKSIIHNILMDLQVRPTSNNSSKWFKVGERDDLSRS